MAGATPGRCWGSRLHHSRAAPPRAPVSASGIVGTGGVAAMRPPLRFACLWSAVSRRLVGAVKGSREFRRSHPIRRTPNLMC
jgi:hypothetical protein